MGATVSNEIEKIVPMLLVILSNSFVCMGRSDKPGRLFVELCSQSLSLNNWLIHERLDVLSGYAHH